MRRRTPYVIAAFAAAVTLGAPTTNSAAQPAATPITPTTVTHTLITPVTDLARQLTSLTRTPRQDATIRSTRQRARPVGPRERKLRTAYRILHRRVRARLGNRAAGRHIVADGIRTSRGSRPATPAELREAIGTLRRMLTPRRPGPSTAAPTHAPAAAAPNGALERIAQCESGGNPRAVSADGRYRGKYQFDYQTWRSVGGAGDPATAPEAEQDRRAAMLMARRGTAPWPNCG
jgi:soluble lytic murein transglycosylase-like protein